MALLCMNNDIHMRSLLFHCSLILPFPLKTFPGQVFSYVHLRWRESIWRAELLLRMEGDRVAPR